MSTKSNPLQVKDRVVLEYTGWGDDQRFPVWAGSQGYVLGTITARDSYAVNILWDNGVEVRGLDWTRVSLADKSHIKKLEKIMATKSKISVELFRQKGATYLKFEVPEEIENIFKGKSKEEKESQKWPGLKFYYVPELTGNENYKSKLRNYGLFDDFGDQLFKGSNMNIAFIRTVGGKGQILIGEELPYSVVSTKMRDLIAFLKEFYQEYFSDYSAKGSVLIEI